MNSGAIDAAWLAPHVPALEIQRFLSEPLFIRAALG
jgi:hypothetical protein